MNNRYEIVFENVSGYRVGDVVPGNLLASDEKGIEYLLNVGAIKQTNKKEQTRQVSPAVEDQVSSAIQEFKERARVAEEQNEAFQAVIEERDKTILSLNEELANKTKEIEDLKSKVIA